MDLTTQNYDSGALGFVDDSNSDYYFVDDINDKDYSNFSLIGYRFREKEKLKNNEKLISNPYTMGGDIVKDLPRGMFGIKRRKKITPNQKFPRLKSLFHNNKFLQNYINLLVRRNQLLEQLKVMRNQQQVQITQNEIKSLEAQIKSLQNENKVSLQRKVEGAVPTEIIQAVMVSNLPTTPNQLVSDNYIDELSNSVSDSAVEEIPTNIPSDNVSPSTQEVGIQPTEDVNEALTPKTDLPTATTNKNSWVLPALAIGVVAYLVFKR